MSEGKCREVCEDGRIRVKKERRRGEAWSN
jgi:hypothetical protein